MATMQASEFRRSGYLGKILVALGVAALFASLAFLAQPAAHLFEQLRHGFFAVIPAVGLSILTAARAFAFHQIDYFSLFSHILVLFSAMVAIILGIVVWSSPSTSAKTLPSRASASAQREAASESPR